MTNEAKEETIQALKTQIKLTKDRKDAALERYRKADAEFKAAEEEVAKITRKINQLEDIINVIQAEVTDGFSD